MADLRPILLVEDNPKDLELTLAALGKCQLANEIVVARDGAEALDYKKGGLAASVDRADGRASFEARLRQGGYDIILSDFQLPGYDGGAALVLARELAPDTPFIFVSGVVGEEFAIDSLKQGAVD